MPDGDKSPSGPKITLFPRSVTGSVLRNAWSDPIHERSSALGRLGGQFKDAYNTVAEPAKKFLDLIGLGPEDPVGEKLVQGGEFIEENILPYDYGVGQIGPGMMPLLGMTKFANRLQEEARRKFYASQVGRRVFDPYGAASAPPPRRVVGNFRDTVLPEHRKPPEGERWVEVPSYLQEPGATIHMTPERGYNPTTRRASPLTRDIVVDPQPGTRQVSYDEAVNSPVVRDTLMHFLGMPNIVRMASGVDENDAVRRFAGRYNQGSGALEIGTGATPEGQFSSMATHELTHAAQANPATSILRARGETGALNEIANRNLITIGEQLDYLPAADAARMRHLDQISLQYGKEPIAEAMSTTLEGIRKHPRRNYNFDKHLQWALDNKGPVPLQFQEYNYFDDEAAEALKFWYSALGRGRL